MKRLFVVALSLFLMACTGQESPSPITENTKGNQFHNAFFGVSVEKPDGWYAQSPEETIALQQRGSAALVGDKEELKAMVEASLKSSVPIFGFFEVPPGTPDKLNPNVMGVAENLAGFPGVKTGCDYLHHVKTLLEQGRMPYHFAGQGQCETIKLAGRSLDVIEGSVEMGELTVTQRYYALVRERYAVAFVQTFFDEEGRDKTAKVIDSLVID